MSALIPLLTIDRNYELVYGWVTRQLTSIDLQLVQTFDLKVARLAHGDCNCPHHGTAQCDCQMLVLLVYQKGNESPATLVVHGQDDKTWLSFVNPLGQRAEPALESKIRKTLISVCTELSSSVEVKS